MYALSTEKLALALWYGQKKRWWTKQLGNSLRLVPFLILSAVLLHTLSVTIIMYNFL